MLDIYSKNMKLKQLQTISLKWDRQVVALLNYFNKLISIQ